jgi:hypothetical protein
MFAFLMRSSMIPSRLRGRTFSTDMRFFVVEHARCAYYAARLP